MKLTFCLNFFLFASVVGLFVKPLSAMDLTDIRTGYHKSYSRIVLEFSGPVRFKLLESKETPAIIVDIASGGEIRNFQKVSIYSADPFIREVKFKKEGPLISVIVFLKNNSFTINQSELNWPYRIVIDIYFAGTQLQSAVANKTRATPTLEVLNAEPMKFDSTKSILSMGGDNIATDSSDFRADTTDQVTRVLPILDNFFVKPFDIESLTSPFPQNITEKNVQAESTAKTKSNLIWLIGGAFILLDVVLLSFYFSKRGKAKLRGKTLTQNASRKRKIRKNVTKVREGKLPQNNEALINPAFLTYLNDALEKQQEEPVGIPVNDNKADEISEISKAIKLDTLIGTLTEAVSTEATSTSQPTNKVPTPPEFKEIAVDLNLNNSETTEETAKRDLIGKDGREFMQNIKRLYIN